MRKLIFLALAAFLFTCCSEESSPEPNVNLSTYAGISPTLDLNFQINTVVLYGGNPTWEIESLIITGGNGYGSQVYRELSAGMPGFTSTGSGESSTTVYSGLIPYGIEDLTGVFINFKSIQSNNPNCHLHVWLEDPAIQESYAMWDGKILDENGSPIEVYVHVEEGMGLDISRMNVYLILEY